MSSSTKKYWDIDQPTAPRRVSVAGAGIQILVAGTEFDDLEFDAPVASFHTPFNLSPAFDAPSIVWS